MRSILEKFTKVITEPYPHLVIEDALPEELYNQLENEWPTQQLLATEPFDGGICYRLKADQMLKEGVVFFFSFLLSLIFSCLFFLITYI